MDSSVIIAGKSGNFVISDIFDTSTHKEFLRTDSDGFISRRHFCSRRRKSQCGSNFAVVILAPTKLACDKSAEAKFRPEISTLEKLISL